MMPPQFERVHVLTIVTALVETIKRLFVTLIVLLFLLFRGGDATGDLGEIVAVAIGGVFLLISAVFTYYTFGYAVSGGNLFIKTGLISKNMRTIPMDRIQNVNITRPLVHQIWVWSFWKLRRQLGRKQKRRLGRCGMGTRSC